MTTRRETTVPNSEMLFRTLDRVIVHPEEHYQGRWRCETGCCFAGHAALEAGGVWVDSVYQANAAHAHYLIAEPTDPLERTELVTVTERDGRLAEVRVIHVADRARRVLGINPSQATELFGGSNTVEQLKDLVAEFTSGS